MNSRAESWILCQTTCPKIQNGLGSRWDPMWKCSANFSATEWEVFDETWLIQQRIAPYVEAWVGECSAAAAIGGHSARVCPCWRAYVIWQESTFLATWRFMVLMLVWAFPHRSVQRSGIGQLFFGSSVLRQKRIGAGTKGKYGWR